MAESVVKSIEIAGLLEESPGQCGMDSAGVVQSEMRHDFQVGHRRNEFVVSELADVSFRFGRPLQDPIGSFSKPAAGL